MSGENTCRTCRYWAATRWPSVPQFTIAECRRRAPIHANSPTPWPQTMDENWCGEYERVAEPADDALALLREALPIIEAHTPPLSTHGTMVSLRNRIRALVHAHHCGVRFGARCTCGATDQPGERQ